MFESFGDGDIERDNEAKTKKILSLLKYKAKLLWMQDGVYRGETERIRQSDGI